MIVDFEDYKAFDSFENHVIPLITTANTSFSYYKEDLSGLVVLEKNPLYFVFLSYISNGVYTHYPTLEQSMNNEKGKTRKSSGEWVVETIFQAREEDAQSIFNKIEDKNINENLIPFIREELYNF